MTVATVKPPHRPHKSVSCEGKQRQSERTARRAARILNYHQAERVHAYACPHCSTWHVGYDHGWEDE